MEQRNNKRWKQDEINFIRQNLDQSVSWLSIKLNRSEGSINTMLWKLKKDNIGQTTSVMPANQSPEFYYKNLSPIDLPNEIWINIKDYEELYKISNCGRIKNLERKIKKWNGFRTHKEKIIKQFFSEDGYLRVQLWKNGENKKYQVARLVGESFIPNIDNKPEINHRNGIKTDNRATELEWATHKENISHSINSGLKGDIKRGGQLPQTILKEGDISMIRQIYAEGNTTQNELSEMFNVSRGAINNITNGRNWKHIGKEIDKDETIFGFLLSQIKNEFTNIYPNESFANEEILNVKESVLNNHELKKCSPQSIFNSILDIARTRLSINKIHKLAYLTAKNNQCTLSICYRGLIKTLTDSGSIKVMDAHIVYEDDYEFEHLPAENKIVHRPRVAKTEAENNARQIAGAYSVAILNDGTKHYHFMEIWKLVKIEQMSTGGESDYYYTEWKTDMYKKCAIRSHYKFLPKRTTLPEYIQRAIMIDDENSSITMGAGKFSAGKKRGGMMDFFNNPKN
jgi:phage RecT family recombinase